jgi:hypothetical protein
MTCLLGGGGSNTVRLGARAFSCSTRASVGGRALTRVGFRALTRVGFRALTRVGFRALTRAGGRALTTARARAALIRFTSMDTTHDDIFTLATGR